MLIVSESHAGNIQRMGLLQIVRDRFHPLHHARASRVGRIAIRALDRPAWVSIPDISFGVRGRLLTHGLSYRAGLQEKNPKAIALACLKQFEFRSFWDVGANFGYYAWLLRSAAPALKLILVEPLPSNAKLIRETIKKNRLTEAILIEAGASDRDDDGVLHADTLGGSTSTLNDEETFEQRHYKTTSAQIRIPLIRLDSLRERYGRPDFVKIDVEGHEATTLRGAAKIIAQDRPTFFIECLHPERACLNVFRSSDYRIIDADTLGTECDRSSTNFYCIPSERADATDELLRHARSFN